MDILDFTTNKILLLKTDKNLFIPLYTNHDKLHYIIPLYTMINYITKLNIPLYTMINYITKLNIPLYTMINYKLQS